MISSAVVPATTPDFSAVDGGDEFFCHIVAAIVLMQCCVCEQISPETLFQLLRPLHYIWEDMMVDLLGKVRKCLG